MITNQRIHNRILKSMPHMQRTRDIRRRNHNAIRWRIGIARRLEIAFAFPNVDTNLVRCLKVSRSYPLFEAFRVYLLMFLGREYSLKWLRVKRGKGD